MIELYVALSLLTLGYIFNENKAVLSSTKRKLDVRDLPSQKSLHESDHSKTVEQEERARGHKAFIESEIYRSDEEVDRAKKWKIPRTISKNYGMDADETLNKSREKPSGPYSQLLGKSLSANQFVHNNMVPFFRGKNVQNTDPHAFQTKLESFTGTPEHHKPKRETPSFFTPKKDMGNVGGAAQNVDFVESRIPVPVSHNNVLPFKQEKVGPGLGQKYGSTPTGGFHQFEVRDYAMPKTVDQLRPLNNPKVTFKGRTIEGQKGSEMGKIGRVAKNRVDKFYKNTPDMYLKTTGAVLAPKLHPKIVVPQTNRQETSKEYTGGAYDASRQQIVKGKSKIPHRQQLDKLPKGHANATDIGKGADNDHGKTSIQIYSNNREKTTEKTYQGNLTSIVKAITAPIEDILRFNRKELMVDNPRTFGQMNVQIPEKAPAHDPNDVARTTIKETTLSEVERANLRGHSKSIAYDPNDVARTTIKETVLTEAELANLKGPLRAYVYDPNDVARTTVKETTVGPSENANLKGHTKLYVYDPNSVARTTIKETTLSDAERINLRGHEKNYVYDPNDVARTTVKEMTLQEAERLNIRGDKMANVVYDPNDKMRITVRETLDDIDTGTNLTGEIKAYVYDPNDVAKTTVKETTFNENYTGNADGRTDEDGYKIAPTDIKDTTRQFTSDKDYSGQVDGQRQHDGYKVAPRDMRNTTRQFTSDNDYYGSAGDQTDHKQMSYENIYNAEIDDTQELLLKGRAPTKQGVKIGAGPESVKLDHRQTALNYEDIVDRQFGSKDVQANQNQNTLPPSLAINLTRMPCDEKNLTDRLLTGRVDHSKNPFIQSII